MNKNTAAVSKAVKKRRRRNNGIAWLFNAPYLVYSLVFMLLPLGWAFWLSLTDWNLMSPEYNFVKLENFINLFADEKVRAAFWNSLRYLVPIVVLCFALGIGIALLVSRLPEKIKGFAAVMFFIPYLTSGVSTSVMVKYLFSYNSALSIFLREHFNLNVNWLQSKAAFWILVVMIVWKMAGYYALFVLSAIENVSEDVYEAGMLDGCTGIRKLLYITLPMIMPTITSVVVLAAGLSFQIFSEPFLLTGGGPALATTTWQLEIYNASFTRFRAGYGAAMAIANAVQIFIVIQLITWLLNKLNKKFGW
ncbi:multiple sugar transport system permease protein [Anaerocolumna jejuensis DSM 15929]|uniref:Multiple sugar transport system permease protein n=1 Tax=Anaerocolumna jejuensis DSM 15929 TaxID=1121322 RepID=A0A1M6TC45_9FIRM|nr:sugar ABC transporter permease [Anaerocolumna jejuensis]SHK54406.1 multiple sugar transport system permease protein [Anaerocolumna jejuensis DSM 15929]